MAVLVSSEAGGSDRVDFWGAVVRNVCHCMSRTDDVHELEQQYDKVGSTAR